MSIAEELSLQSKKLVFSFDACSESGETLDVDAVTFISSEAAR